MENYTFMTLLVIYTLIIPFGRSIIDYKKGGSTKRLRLLCLGLISGLMVMPFALFYNETANTPPSKSLILSTGVHLWFILSFILFMISMISLTLAPVVKVRY